MSCIISENAAVDSSIMTTGPGGGRVFFLRRNSTALEGDGEDEDDRLGGDGDTEVGRVATKDNCSLSVVGVGAAIVGEDDDDCTVEDGDGDGDGGNDNDD